MYFSALFWKVCKQKAYMKRRSVNDDKMTTSRSSDKSTNTPATSYSHHGTCVNINMSTCVCVYCSNIYTMKKGFNYEPLVTNYTSIVDKLSVSLRGAFPSSVYRGGENIAEVL